MNATITAPVDPKRVLAALAALHRAWPLEQRLRLAACEATRETYLAVLLRWVQTGAAPTPEGFDREALEELVALDALKIVDGRITCPPFSAAATDILVHVPHETVHALSALDALALPRLQATAAIIEATCPVSGARLQIVVGEGGTPRAEDLGVARVALRKVADQVLRYAFDLAPGIRFLRPSEAEGARQTLSLAEASAVANAFYAFQRKLIRGEPL
ncbi:organomercurial lyase [Thiobacter aerophilum]|uniref:Organomercurial lyase n=1 Tax=Thiobacter aerophilum TaxID=3121275 RepID=A0ABV0EEH1_9BURK